MSTVADTDFLSGDVIEFVDRLCEWLREFEFGAFTGRQARGAVAAFGRLERLAHAATVLSAQRVDETAAFAGTGHRTAVAHLADTTGSSRGEATAALHTATRLGELPATDAAFRSGELSGAQAAAVTAAAIGSPDSEADLLRAARTGPLGELKRRCHEVEVRRDQSQDQHTRRHAKRSFRRFDGDDCMRQYVGALPPEVAGEVEAIWDVFTERAFRQAHSEGRRERHDAYVADGLLAMARAAQGGGAESGGAPVRPRFVIRLDMTALKRGWAEPGEVCEIPGVGPIDVATARSMFGGAVVDFVIHEGVDIKAVAHAGRKANARQLAALLSREYVCETVGCGHRANLEIDHLTEYAKSRRTDVGELGWKCAHCHRLKSAEGWTDGPLQPDGRRTLDPPQRPPPDG
ncbi:MAG TPA: DUF222 domain-containing protein [Acidimicrobiia bacterium]